MAKYHLAMRQIIVAVAILALSILAAAQNVPGNVVNLDSVTLDEDILRVQFVDIGGGLAALIETPGGKHMPMNTVFKT